MIARALTSTDVVGTGGVVQAALRSARGVCVGGVGGVWVGAGRGGVGCREGGNTQGNLWASTPEDDLPDLSRVADQHQGREENRLHETCRSTYPANGVPTCTKVYVREWD